jgi:acetoin utilization protein AcuB
MDIKAPVSSIMTTELKTIRSDDNLMTVKELFEQYDFHHLPVVDDDQISGILSKSDFLYFLRGYTNNDIDRFIEAAKLRAFKVEEVMKKELVTLKPSHAIKEALDIFEDNKFHCIPIVEEEELKGIVTPLDIIKALNAE